MNNAQLVLFDTIFMNMIALNREVRERSPDLVTRESPIEAFRDFASIHFDPGQGTGKSVWIGHTAKRHDAIISMSEAHHAFYPEAVARLYDMPYLRARTNEEKFLNFRYVFVEQSHWFAKNDMAKIYRIFGDTDTTFVLM